MPWLLRKSLVWNCVGSSTVVVQSDLLNGNSPANPVRITEFWQEWAEHFFPNWVVEHTPQLT